MKIGMVVIISDRVFMNRFSIRYRVMMISSVLVVLRFRLLKKLVILVVRLILLKMKFRK